MKKKKTNLETSFEMIVNSFGYEGKIVKDHRHDFYLMSFFDFEPIKRKRTREDKSNSIDRRQSLRMLHDSEDDPENSKIIETKCFVTINKKMYSSIAKIEEFHLVISFEKKLQRKMRLNPEYYFISFNSIAKIDKTLFTQGNYELEITTRDYRSYVIKIPSNNYYFANMLEEAAFPNKDTKYFFYAYSYFNQYHQQFNRNINYNHNNNTGENKEEGWDIYSIEQEFKRQKIDFGDKSSKYKLLDNTSFNYCNTYPSRILIPSCIKENDITLCASFRTKNRFPALTYQYINKRCIWRSSQSKGGVTFQKCEQDVNLITKITDLGKKLMLYDARPYLNAVANVFKGAGYENINHYPKITMEVKFCDLNNIHAVKTSLNKLFNAIQACTNDNKKYLSNIENSLWYDYINLLIKSSIDITRSIKDDCTVLVHCSDGWDRTTQLCATSQLILDPYYRTLEGFIVLIEKDWLSFGHQFALRNWNYAQKKNSEDQSSPIFIQWLDAIYQLIIQNFTLFEFNVDFITFLANELYNGKYGTFLFNCEKDRNSHKAKTKTVSIWIYVLDNKSLYINPFYNKVDNNGCLELDYSFKKIRLWEEFLFKEEEKKSSYGVIRDKMELFEHQSNQIKEYKRALKEIEKLLQMKNKEAIPETLQIINSCLESDPMASFIIINEDNQRNKNNKKTESNNSNSSKNTNSNIHKVNQKNNKEKDKITIIDSYV